MIIDCVSDLHGHYPELQGGDLLIVAGDLTSHSGEREIDEFSDWIDSLDYKKIVVIGGNHDWYCETFPDTLFGVEKSEYLSDSGTEFKGLCIWGSPWVKSFPGMNPKCKAFTLDSDEDLAQKWKLIPNDIDILITHSPPYGILDSIDNQENCGSYHVGSKTLITAVKKIKPSLHIFGHVHEGYGEDEDAWDIGLTRKTKYVNASHVNECYEPINKPIRVIL